MLEFEGLSSTSREKVIYRLITLKKASHFLENGSMSARKLVTPKFLSVNLRRDLIAIYERS